MLFVFHVETGTMLTMDIKWAMESVSSLQEAISKSRLKLPVNSQVLLISGGESLNPNSRVCSYSTGTDTNPIYLFSKNTIESATPPQISTNKVSVKDLREKFEVSLEALPTYETVISRSNLAMEFHEYARELVADCQSLVHDQHLQHQGWAAVIANLEDITNSFKNRSKTYLGKYSDFIEMKTEFDKLISNFSHTINVLKKIPILKSLCDVSDSFVTDSSSLTLMEWISAQDKKSTLEKLINQCRDGFEQFTLASFESLKSEVDEIIDSINHASMKEVKGLEERLFGLEQLLFSAKSLIKEQEDLAQSFIQNKTRAENLQDVSILPDLCTSHKQQLLVMLNNHKRLCEIHRRCSAAKEELSTNLHTRLRWVMFVEKSVSDLDNNLSMHYQTHRKVKKKFGVLQQICLAPKVYCSFVLETRRRLNFSLSFCEWSQKLSKDSSLIYKEEVERRLQFNEEYRHHFLHVLFPGFEDLPPKFATETPRKFDSFLPAISTEEINNLKSLVSEISAELMPSLDCAVVTCFPLPGLSTNGSVTAGGGSGFEPITMPREVLSPDDPCLSDIVVLVTDEVAPSTFSEPLTAPSSKRFSASVAASPPELNPAPLKSGAFVSLQDVSNKSTLEESMVGLLSGNAVPNKTNSKSPTLQNIQSDTKNAQLVDNQQSRKCDSTAHPIQQSFENDRIPDPAEASSSPIYQPIPLTQTNSTQISSRLTQKSSSSSSNVNYNSDKCEDPDSLVLSPNNSSLNSPATRCASLELASDSFTTADFYIDEPMPSSLADSPQTDLDIQFNKQSSLLKKCQEDLLANNTKLLKFKQLFKDFLSNINKFQAYIDKKFTCNNDQINGTSETFDLINVDFTGMGPEKIDSVSSLINFKFTSFEKLIDNDLQTKQSICDSLQHQIGIERDRYEDITTELLNWREKLEENERHAQSLAIDHAASLAAIVKENSLEVEALKINNKHEIESLDCEHQSELNLARSQFEELIREIKSTHSEELEKTRSEYEQKIDSQHKQLILEHELELERVHNEQVKLLQHNTDKLESRITEMQIEFDQLTRNHRETLQSESKLETEIENIKRKHEMELLMLKEQQVESLRLSREELSSSLSIVHKHQTDLLEQEHINQMKKLTDSFFKPSSTTCFVQTEDKSFMRRDSHSFLSDIIYYLSHSLSNNKLACMENILKEFTLYNEENASKRNLNKYTDKFVQCENNPILVSDSSNYASEYHFKHSQENRILQERLEKELDSANQEISRLRNQLVKQPGDVSSTLDTAPTGSHSEKLTEMCSMLKQKDEELSSLQSKYIDLMMTSSSLSHPRDKVSIMSCNVGDAVLLCLDEKHDHYVVFSVGKTLHFLHPDCLEPLSLQSVRGEQRKSWALVEITAKEHCQAKKVNNRFHVPLGTKFYRIKAKPWERTTRRDSVTLAPTPFTHQSAFSQSTLPHLSTSLVTSPPSSAPSTDNMSSSSAVSSFMSSNT